MSSNWLHILDLVSSIGVLSGAHLVGEKQYKYGYILYIAGGLITVFVYYQSNLLFSVFKMSMLTLIYVKGYINHRDEKIK